MEEEEEHAKRCYSFSRENVLALKSISPFFRIQLCTLDMVYMNGIWLQSQAPSDPSFIVCLLVQAHRRMAAAALQMSFNVSWYMQILSSPTLPFIPEKINSFQGFVLQKAGKKTRWCFY